MSRRALVFALVLALALPLAAPAAAQAGGYAHSWQLEGIASGETGVHYKTVLDSKMALSREGDRFTGAIEYSDVVGATSGDTFSQSSEIDLLLIGEKVSGRDVAAGSFIGTATLVLRDARSPQEGGSRGALTGTPRGTVTYRVAGRWTADLDGRSAKGELLYEGAEALRVAPEGAVVRDVAWFNGLSNEFADNLGAAQTFSVTVGGDAPPPPGFWETLARGASGDAWEQPPSADVEAVAKASGLMRALGAGAVGLPAGSVAVDVDLGGPYLDAKNRAAGLLGDDGPTAEGLAEAWAAAYAAVPARLAPGDAVSDAVSRIVSATAVSDAANEDALLERARQAAESGADTSIVVPLVRPFAAVAEAVASPKPYGSVLAATAAVGREVADADVPRTGPDAEAVLAAADSQAAPEIALVVRSMERSEPLDVPATSSAAPLPTEVMVRHGVAAGGVAPSLRLPDGSSVTPAAWLAYRRGDGAVYWLPSEDAAVALTDGSLLGWGYRTRRAHLVDADRAGRVLATYPVN